MVFSGEVSVSTGREGGTIVKKGGGTDVMLLPLKPGGGVTVLQGNPGGGGTVLQGKPGGGGTSLQGNPGGGGTTLQEKPGGGVTFSTGGGVSVFLGEESWDGGLPMRGSQTLLFRSSKSSQSF